MKTITVSFLLMLAIATIHAQDYQINFEGTGASTTIDSVQVKNLTQGSSLTLPLGTDALHLTGTIGISKTSKDEKLLTIYPNPMQGQTELSFYAKKAGNTQLIIYDISGRKVLQTGSNISQGIQNYQIIGLSHGTYFVNVSGENYSYTAKLISLNTTPCEARIDNLNTKPEGHNTLRSQTEPYMPYTIGDCLLFKGISGNYATIITDKPTSNKTITFNFVPCTDADNNNYAMVQIGTQKWMAENLRTSKYSDGTPIPKITDDNAWNSLTSGAYCWYNNDSATYENPYGKLYNWYSIVSTNKICPTGWHMPSNAEWITLTNFLGSEDVAGGKLKETNTMHWQSPNIGATNETGYSALPGGYRDINQSFVGIGEYGYWWNSTENNTDSAKYRLMYYGYSDVNGGNNDKKNALSIRCVSGDLPTLTTTSVTDITANSAKCGGIIISDGGANITAKGICWSTSPNPTITSNNYTSNCSGTSPFTCNLIGLSYNVKYYVRAYATNVAGTSYGEELDFTPVGIYSIGQSFGGGIIFYIDWTGEHGLISSTSDQAISAVWGCYGTTTGASGLVVGSGQTNTTAIMNACGQQEIAARICANLELNGYSDWYLPSIYELTGMYDKSNLIGGFDYSARYWSSSEFNINEAWYKPFYPGFTAHYSDKTDLYRIRAIRSF